MIDNQQEELAFFSWAQPTCLDYEATKHYFLDLALNLNIKLLPLQL